MELSALLTDARAAGLRLAVRDGRLAVTGPRRAEPLARALLGHKAVLADWIGSRRVVLDWHADAARWAPEPRPCHRCGRPARLLDDDVAPVHKLCAERALLGVLVDLTGDGCRDVVEAERTRR